MIPDGLGTAGHLSRYAPRCVAMRPPIDLPPMNSFDALTWRCSTAPTTARRNASSSTGARSGVLRRCLHVGKVERHDRDAARGQAARVVGHERMKMTGAGAVREHEQRIELAIALGRIQRGGNGCVGISGKLEGDRTHTNLYNIRERPSLDTRTVSYRNARTLSRRHSRAQPRHARRFSRLPGERGDHLRCAAADRRRPFDRPRQHPGPASLLHARATTSSPAG